MGQYLRRSEEAAVPVCQYYRRPCSCMYHLTRSCDDGRYGNPRPYAKTFAFYLAEQMYSWWFLQ